MSTTAPGISGKSVIPGLSKWIDRLENNDKMKNSINFVMVNLILLQLFKRRAATKFLVDIIQWNGNL